MFLLLLPQFSDVYMFKKYFFSFLLALFSSVLFAQRTELKGKIRAYTEDLEGIYIINLNTNLSTSTERGGYFQIQAQENDTLQFSAVHLKSKKIVLTYSNLKSPLFFVDMELASYNLKEVEIKQYKDINAVDLGILAKPAKAYTPAERRLYTATGGGSNTYGLNTQVSLDAILNSISGRTTMLRKEVEVEKKEHTLELINEWFEDSFYINKFNIPAEYVKGFQFFLAENTRFVDAVKSKNKTLTIFLIGELSVVYLKLLNEK